MTEAETATVAVRRAWGPWLAVIALLVVLIAGVVLHSPWLSVSEIEIVGAEHVDAAGRLAGAGVGHGAIMIWLDVGMIEEAIAADPWAAEVHAERVFPDRLVIEVVEHRPAAWIEGLLTWMLVADDGTIIETASDPGDGVMLVAVPFPDALAGSNPSDPVWREVVRLGAVLAPDLAASATLVRSLSEVWLEIPGYRVRLGHPIDLGEKGLVLQTLLDEGVATGSAIDLVAPRRPAVTPAPPALVEGGSGPGSTGEPEDGPEVEASGG